MLEENKVVCAVIELPKTNCDLQTEVTDVINTTLQLHGSHIDTGERHSERVSSHVSTGTVAIPHRGGEHAIAVPIAPDADAGRGKSAGSSVGAVDLPGAAHRNTWSAAVSACYWQHGNGSEARTDGELAALLPHTLSAATAEERAQAAQRRRC